MPENKTIWRLPLPKQVVEEHHIMKNRLLLRIADEDDIDAVVELLNLCYRGGEGWTHEAGLISGARLNAADMQSMLNGKKHFFFVFDNNGLSADVGALIGCIVVQMDVETADHTAHIEMVAVHPAVQNQGVGGEMLNAVEDFAAQHLRQGWMKMLVVEQRRELVDYYRRRGYELADTPKQSVDERYYGHAERPEIRMVELGKRLMPK